MIGSQAGFRIIIFSVFVNIQHYVTSSEHQCPTNRYIAMLSLVFYGQNMSYVYTESSDVTGKPHNRPILFFAMRVLYHFTLACLPLHDIHCK